MDAYDHILGTSTKGFNTNAVYPVSELAFVFYFLVEFKNFKTNFTITKKTSIRREARATRARASIVVHVSQAFSLLI